MSHINKTQHDILKVLNANQGNMTYVIKNVLVAPYHEFKYNWHDLKTSNVLYHLKKLERIGLVERVTGKSNPYKIQLKWMLTPMRDKADD